MNLPKLLARMAPWALIAAQAWWVDQFLRQHGRVLLAEERLRGRVEQLEEQATALARSGLAAPGGDATVYAPPEAADDLDRQSSMADQVREGQYALYHAMQDAAITSVPPFPAGQFRGAGIVMLAGGPRYFTSAWVCLTVLRQVLGCRLPIQVWYLGVHEMSARMIELLQRFDVECVNAQDVQRRHPRRAVGGWELKPYAILHSPFKDVIFLDADNVPLIDPAGLLACPEYQATGAIFWPDLHALGRDHPIWAICRLPYRHEPRFETGQMVIDKERCWRPLHLTLHLNEHSDFYYRYLPGDAETFHMAWRMMAQPCSMPLVQPAWVVGLINSGDANFADVLQQHDFDGRVIFQHRTGAKWTAWGKNFQVPGFELEAACLEALETLRQLWDGRVDLQAAVAEAPAAEAALLQARYFLYRRIGSDERVLSLLPGQRVGEGGTVWEQQWHLAGEGKGLTLVIEGKAGVTCQLLRESDGVWRGRWLHHEQVPVELVPLGSAAVSNASADCRDRAGRRDESSGTPGVP